KTVAVSINKHEVAAMKKIAAGLGVEFKFDPMINPRIDCSSSPLAVRLTPAEIVSFDFDDQERIDAWRKMATQFAPMPVPEGELENGDPEKPVDFLCSTAHLRAAALNIAVAPHGACEYCEDGERRGWIEEMLQQVGGPIEAVPLPAITRTSSCAGGCSSCSVR